jgi:hypothetical protein
MTTPLASTVFGGANYYDHGPLQAATVDTVDRRDVSTSGLPSTSTFTDEWYNLVPFPSKVRFLAAVEENTMAAGTRGSMGHPVAVRWTADRDTVSVRWWVSSFSRGRLASRRCC